MLGILACADVWVIVNAAMGGVASHPMSVSDEALFAAMDLDRPGLASVRSAVKRGDYPAAAKSWAAYFRKRETPTPHFSRDTWGPFIRRAYPQLVEPILAAADRVVQGRIGHPPYVMPVEDGRIQWLHNPTKDTNYVSIVGSQWFMNPLGRAYLLTGDEKYARAFAWVFGSWYDHQPEILEHQGGLGFDPIYRAYYPGIRSRILTENYYCMARSPALTPELHVKVLKQLLGSASWLYAREQRFRVGNQQVAAVVGLGVVGIVFPEFKEAERWVACAETRMTEHLKRDFFADGGHKELCTQYHKTCLRDMGYVALTAERNGRASLFRSDAAPMLERAYDWLSRLVMPTGQTPPLHSAVFATDWAVHLTIAARWFNRPDFLWQARRFWRKGIAPNQKAPFGLGSLLVCEALDLDAMTSITPAPPPYRCIHLKASGFAVMRTGWDPDDDYLVFQYGWANTGHAYPGALSFLLAMKGELVATHPGSPRSYRHPAYAYCHSTPSHNVVTIDLKSYKGKRRIAPGGKLYTYADLPGAWYVRGEHEGYRPTFGAVHERSILALKGGPVWVRDTVRGATGHEAQWNLHTPLGLSVKPDRSAVLLGKVDYHVRPAFADQIRSVKTEKRWAAVLPRDCQPADCGKMIPVLRYVKPIGRDGVQFAVAISEGPAVIEALGERAFRMHSGGRAYVVLHRDRATSVEGGGVVSDAECACVRFKGDSPDRAWVIGGKRLTINGTEWLGIDAPNTIELNEPM